MRTRLSTMRINKLLLLLPLLLFLLSGCNLFDWQLGDIDGRNAFAGIHLVNIDGTGDELITPANQDYSNPCFSSDGSKLLVDTDELYGEDMVLQGLFIITLANRQLNHLLGAFQAKWSPSDQQIVSGGGGPMRVFDSLGTNSLTFFDEARYTEEPSWSPDGTKIVYLYRTPNDDDRAIYYINPDGTGRVQVTSSNYAIHPRWSPDGSRILYGATDEQGVYQIFAHILASGSTERITTGNIGVWLAGGDEIAFIRDGVLYGSGADGSSETVLYDENYVYMIYPSPDGNKLIYELLDGRMLEYAYNGNGSLYVINKDDGSNPVYLGAGSRVDWDPSGSRIAYRKLTSI